MVKFDNSHIPKTKGIYMIWFSNNADLLYIGSSKNMYKRCGEHLTMLKNNKHHNNKLQNYVNKYGIDNFNFCVHCVKENIELSELKRKELSLLFNVSRRTIDRIKTNRTYIIL